MKTTSFFPALLVVSVAALFLAATPLSAGLKLGDKAPPMKITKWVQGTDVDLAKMKGEKVTVVEFWATWCGPCITSIPHLTDLQKKHKKNVVIIGVTKPDARNSLDMVESFVEKQGKKMAYTVAFDGDGKTYEAYMRSAEQSGIPTAFIVNRKGQLAWLGHPMAMDRPLEEIVAGTFDIEKARKQLENSMRVKKLYREFYTRARERNFEAVGKLAREMIELSHDNATMLNGVAWILLTHPELKGKFRALALKAAERCDELTGRSSWMYLDTLALARFENGATAEAVALQKKAMELARKDKIRPEAMKEFEERLKLFEEGAK